jgi:hypothetical protein
MRINKIVKCALLEVRKRYYLSKYPMSSSGTVEWLIGTEIKYGGIETEVPRNKVSPKDPRTKEQLSHGGMVGGDRMLHHGYAKKYSEYLLPYVKKGKPVTVTEIGILKGTGIAIWCDLFQNGRIIGLDLDLEHMNSNMENLKNLGAFKRNQPEIYEFDQFLDNTEYLRTILKGDRIDICIDDGPHSVESILSAMKSVMPYLAHKFVYFIEDNKDVHKELKSIYPALIVDVEGRLTIVSKNGA